MAQLRIRNKRKERWRGGFPERIQRSQGAEGTGLQSYKQALEGKKVGIIHKRYPEVNLNTEQLKATQKAIIEEILKVEEESLQSKFLGAVFKAGYLVINCADEVTEEWLGKPSLDSSHGRMLTSRR